jgi:hypothetical protein
MCAGAEQTCSVPVSELHAYTRVTSLMSVNVCVMFMKGTVVLTSYSLLAKSGRPRVEGPLLLLLLFN